jgi:hypothetical protein
VFYLKFAVMPLGPLGLGLITGGIGVGLSAVDIIRGNRMRKTAEENLRNLKRPMMSVPEAQMQQVGLARMGAMQDMPGYSLALQQQQLNMQQGMGNASRAATSSQDLLSAATSGMTGQQDVLAQLAMQNAQSRQQGMQNYQETLGGLANTQKTMFDVNQMQPYALKYQTYTNNIQQGRELMNSGMQGLGSSVGSAMPFVASGAGEQGWLNFKNFGFGGQTTQ